MKQPDIFITHNSHSELPTPMRPWKLAEVNYAYVKEHPYEVAVLPLGATEPHNLHLPYGTDVFEADAIGEAICQAAHEQGAQRGALADDAVRHRDESASVSAVDERQPVDFVRGDHRPRRVAGAPWRAEDRAVEQSRRQRYEGACFASCMAARTRMCFFAIGTRCCRTFTTRSSSTATITPARWRRRLLWRISRTW